MRVSIDHRPTKAGEMQTATFDLERDRHYPDLTLCGASMSWRNDMGTLFRRYGNEATGLPDTYTAELEPGWPIVLRGKDLGRVRAELRWSPPHGDNTWWVHWTTDYGKTLTDGQIDYLRASFEAALIDAIERNAAALYAAAYQAVEQSIARTLADIRKQMDKMEDEAAKALTAIRPTGDMEGGEQ
jgi:hypothetical protein